MASELEHPSPTVAVAVAVADETVGKKQSKKEARKAERAQRQQGATAASEPSEPAPLAGKYGDVPGEEIQSRAFTCREWTHVGTLDAGKAGRTVLIRGAAQAIRAVGRKMAFLVVRQSASTVQCVVAAGSEAAASPPMVRFAAGLGKYI
uniref:Uncharacterized protein n=1 Tax=Ananas comosus var. bracteatus TaxID=296719 RepID=A0A6V7PB41_ANACO|nr:unnamed protein product [Ananas comosus var. bracteatus]